MKNIFRYFRSIALLAAAAVLIVMAVPVSAEDFQLNASGIPNRALSVDPTGRSEGFSAVLYDNSNGLPTSEANAITETSEGFIWIGSYAGLIRYDGNTFERMDPSGGLTSIKCLYTDSKDRLWIGTNDNGVGVIYRGELRMWGKLEGMASAHTRAITEDTNGNIYVATASGIMMFGPDFTLTALKDEKIAEANMRDLHSAEDGYVYGTTDLGDFMVLRDGELKWYMSAEENPLSGIGAVLPDHMHPGRLYLEAADYKLHYVDVSSGFKVLQDISIEPLKLLKQIEYIDGKIWLCATNGIGVIENGTFRMLDNLPMNNNVGHVMTDYLGNLWFTSTRQGVMKVVPNQFSDLFARFGIPEAVVNSTCFSDGKLFAATDTGLIVLDDNGAVSAVPLTKAVTASGADLGAKDLIEYMTGVRIRSIVRDSSGRLWFSTWRANDLLRYDHGELTAFTVEDGLLSNSLRAVSEGTDGRMLVALTGGVSIIKDDRVIASYGKEDGITNTESLNVTEGLNGEIILGSNGGGLYIIDDKGVRNIDVEDGLPSDIVMRLKCDRRNNVVWIVTSSAIAYMTPDYRIVKIKDFPYPNNFDMYENSKGDMWVLSSNGIYVIPSEKLIANGDIEPVYYSSASGLPCIATANSYSELTPDGDLYIAGSTGVAKVNIERSFVNVNDLKIAVPYIEADGKRVYPDESGSFTVSKEVQKITIPSFVYNYAMMNPQVSYTLEGFDQHSFTVSRKDLSPVDYTNLRGGTYRFVLCLKDAMGRDYNELAVRIYKELHFYEHWWFLLICAVLAVMTVTGIIALIIRRKTAAFLKREAEQKRLFKQTATALVNAIDTKDRYTHGHSSRVAEYSRKLAEMSGKSEKECEDIYYAALLHDVGKIGVPSSIINKDGRLTDEEYSTIKQHPMLGVHILESISEFPTLSIGARSHHERYDGRGYPDGLAGEEIPELARIVAVADAYDAMTSKRSYRDPIPQQKVREEIVKGTGTQFDPKYARLMLHLIDVDTEYEMKDRGENIELENKNELIVGEYRSSVSDGILITEYMTTVKVSVGSDEEATGIKPVPSMILFDSLDGKVHTLEKEIKDLLYFEYGEIWFDGRTAVSGARKAETKINEEGSQRVEKNGDYIIEAVRIKDHALIRIFGKKRSAGIIVALPDSSRFLHIGLTGEHCRFSELDVSKAEEACSANYIPRIAEEISYIADAPTGDIPNVQIDGYRSAHTEGIRIKDGLSVRFCSKCLPTARLVWHCPFVDIFCSDDGTVNGSTYRDLAFMRFDGEFWECDPNCHAEIHAEKTKAFGGWEAWKEYNRSGFEAEVTFRVDGSRITVITENAGISIKNTAVMTDIDKPIYAAITGDQVALTNIRIG